jgi:hypothetical protein
MARRDADEDSGGARVIVHSAGDSDELFLYVNEVLHLQFRKKHYRGMQSYREIKYTIEVYLKDTTIRLEYDDRELWEKVLAELSEHL